MTDTRLPGGAKANICKTCGGCGQERYKTDDLQPEFDVADGRFEGDLFIRKCITCDGLGAIEDVEQYMNALDGARLMQNSLAANDPNKPTPWINYWPKEAPSIFGPMFKIWG